MNARLDESLLWFSSAAGFEHRQVLPHRDIFLGWLSRYYVEVEKRIGSEDASLLTGIVGEVGNNCFDHNLGQWTDIPGCWFDYDVEDGIMWTIISDRGRGILASLKTIQPQLKDDQEAVEMAFHKRISGRSPEQRGNGLKFVRSVVNGNPERGLIFVSGSGRFLMGELTSLFNGAAQVKNAKGGGTYALFLWKTKI